MTAPIFGNKNIPVLFKAGLGVIITIILFPIINLDITFIDKLIPFIIAIPGEIMLGVIIGLSAKLIFAGIQLAGQITGFQMGFAIANIMDPLTSDQVPFMGLFYNLFAMLIFLSINAHHVFLKALVESFKMIPPFAFGFNGSLTELMIKFAGDMFVISIKIGAPVIAALLLTSAALGLIARTVPQMNIFIVAMPIKIVIGLMFTGISLSYLSFYLTQIFNDLGRNIFFLLKAAY